MKITLPNGAIIETESAAELSQILSAMGLSISPVSNKQPEDVVPSHAGRWSERDAGRFMRSLRDGAQKLVKLLLARGDMTTTQVAEALDYEDNRPIGGIMAGLRRVAQETGLPCPVESLEVNGERRLVVDVDFRAVARKALREGTEAEP